MNESAQALAQRIVALHADKKAGEVQPIPSHGATLLECALDQALGELGFWPTDAAIVRRA